MPRNHQTGIALLDVLVALLLLAVALTGACATLIHTVRTTQDAMLASRAVDLAADLAEELKHAHSSELDHLVAALRNRLPAVLPVTGLAPGQYVSISASGAGDEADIGPSLLLTLRWRSARGEVSELSLPVAAPGH